MDKSDFLTNQALRKRTHNARAPQPAARENIYDTIAVVLVGFWLVALGAAYTLNGYVHFFLVGALVMALIRCTQGRRIPFIRGTFFKHKE